MTPKLLILWVTMEFIVNMIFYFLNASLFKTQDNMKQGLIIRDVIKGSLERSLIMVGLLNNYPQVITAFAALKIGTRINDNEHKISNDYFLLGNIISLLAAIYLVVIYTH